MGRRQLAGSFAGALLLWSSAAWIAPWPCRGEATDPAGGLAPPASEAVYRSPCTGAATVRQGNDGSFSHSGSGRYAWDFMMPPGTPIVAARAGVVRRVKHDSAVGGAQRTFSDHANRVLVDHGDGTGASYLHLQHGGVKVRVGEYVIQGEVLGFSGDTGWSTDPHLHYAVVEIASGDSIPSTFADFEPNGGVPAKGQALPPAPPPSIDQATLDLYKATWRKVEAARELGRSGLAWRKATSLPSRKRIAEYHYDRLLTARAAQLRQAVVDELETLIATGKPTDEQVLRAKEMTRFLARAEDDEISELLRRLEDRCATWPADTLEAWRTETSALKAWGDALDAWCEGDRSASRKAYAKALTAARGALRPAAEAALRREVEHWASQIDARLARRVSEVEIVQKTHHKRWLSRDLKELKTEAQRLKKLQLRHWKDEQAATIEAYGQRESRRTQALRTLGER